MSDIDVVEKVLADQPDLPVHIPYAGNTSPGIASFNTRDFIVEENGAVQLSKDVQALTEEATQAAENAKQSEQNAAESEINAQQSEQNAQQSASRAAASATNAKSSEQQAQTHLQQVLATETRINNTEDNIEQIAEEVSNDKIEVENLRTEFTEYVTYVESQASVAAEMASEAQSYSSSANTYMQQAQDAWLQARSEADRAQQITDSIGATFKPKGTITFEELPAQPSAEYEGFMWDISNSFTTDDRFTVGAGQRAPAGSDVSCIETTDGVYKYNISAGLYDLSAYVTKTQLDLETEAREAADNNLSTRIDAKYTKPSSGIPDTDLSIDIKNSLGKADTAYQKPSSGIPKSDLASTVQSSLGKADTAYQKPSEGIAKTDLASPVQTSLNKADSALQSVPVATPFTLGGVKPTTKTSEMTQPVAIDSNGALWTKEGGGSIEYMTDDEVDALFASTPPIPSFAEATWEQIAEISEAGDASTTFAVGDEKTISLSTGEQVTLVILGFNHDDLSDDSGKAGITIGMKELLATTYRMNSTDSNAGGWDDSEMRTSTMDTLLSQLPSDLQGVIKQVNKKATAGGKSTSITTSADKLWLFAEVEVDGTTSAYPADEGEQYEYWQTVKDGTVSADRIKYLSNGSGSADRWWLRSPSVSGSTTFRCITSAGIVTSSSASYTYGVSFGFCV